ncbi:MAG: hypothetical protein O2925_03525 [Actinomycetota bacterium]|nr:hypothetical protein [Actinomycetota bacterium]MDA3027846.1 hypothetical protein [Actinomycetota bacterium]
MSHTAPPTADDTIPAWRRRLARSAVGAFLVGMIVLWTYVLFLSPREGVNRFEDRQWAERAESICADYADDRSLLADYRRLDSGGSELIRERADIIDRATDIVDAMVDELEADLPADAKGQAIVPMWIDEYRIYIDDRRRYTDELRTTGENLPFYETMSEVPISERLATFAADNEMATCSPPLDLGM